MPPVIAAVGAAAFAAAAGTTILGMSVIASAAVIGAATLALNYASQALARQPKFDTAPLSFAAGERTENIRQPIVTRKIVYGQVRLGGAITFFHVTNDNSVAHMVLTLTGHEVEELGQIYFDDEAVTLDGDGAVQGKWLGHATIIKATGSTSGDAAFHAALSAAVGDKWTSAHRQSGCAKLYVKWTYKAQLFPPSLPTVTCVVKGRKVYDPRTAATAWSANAALVIRDYLTLGETAGGVGATAAEIDDEVFRAAAAICDETLTLAAGGTEARYTANGTVDTAEAPEQVLSKLLTACGGTLTFAGGKWRLLPAAWRGPVVDIADANLRGPVKVQSRLTGRETFNGVKGVFVDPAQSWQPVDFPAIASAVYMAEDAGERIWRDAEYPFTTSSARAQRLAKMELLRARQQITVSTTLDLTALRFQPGDVVTFTLADFGWTLKAFECVSWALSLRVADSVPTLVVDCAFRETDASCFEWSAEDTATDAAPDTNLPDPFTVADPGRPSVSESLYETRDGAGVRAKATMTWTAAADGYVVRYVPEFKLSSASAWTPLSSEPVVDGQASYVRDVLDVAPGTYDFRVKAVNYAGYESDYATRSNVAIAGLGARPADESGFAGQAISGVLILNWSQHADLDVRIGGWHRIRHTDKTSGATWADGRDVLGPRIAGIATSAIVPLISGTYMIKAVDSTGNESANFASFVTAAPSIFTFTTLATATEHAAFSGTKTNTVVASSTLKLDTSGGAVLSSGTYTFANRIDLGSVKRARLRPVVTSAVVNVNTLIDSRTDNIDDWADFDGSDGTSASITLYYRETPDDPAGAPTWSAWKAFDVTDVHNRAFEFKVEFASTDPAYNVHVTALAVNAEEI